MKLRQSDASSTMSPSTLRPLRVGEILDAAIKIYSRNARTLMGLTAAMVVPFQALSAVILLSTVSNGSEIPHNTFASIGARSSAHATSLGANAVLTLTSALVTVLTTAACVKAVSDAYLDRPAGISVSLRFALRRVLSLLWLAVMTAVLLVVAFVLLIIPGIWLYAAWSVATPALLIEARGAWPALRRSFQLVRGRWWPTAGVLIASEVMVSVVGGAVQGLLVGIFLTGSSVVVVVALVSLAAAVSAVLTRPFVAAVRTVLYYDLRVRKEGYDVELLAEQLGIPQSELPPALPEGPKSAGQPGGPPYWPPPPGWQPSSG
jgi:hypothetical protein